MKSHPYNSPETAGEPPEQTGIPWKRGLLGLLAVIGIIGLVIAFMLPVSRVAPEDARRFSCRNNLQQIAMALQSYHDVHQTFPPAFTVDAAGKPLHSWRTLILPYLEQQALYDTIDLTKPWDHPVNKAALETKISVYRCPSSAGSPSHTSYLAVVGERNCFHPTKPRGLADITDGTSSTLMVVEVDLKQEVPWMSPSDATEETVLNLHNATRLPHPGGTQAAFASGDVQFFSARERPEKLRAMLTIAGGDNALAED